MIHNKRENIGHDNESILKNHAGARHFFYELNETNNTEDFANLEEVTEEQKEHVWVQFLLQVTYALVLTVGFVGLIFLGQGAFASQRDFASQSPKKMTYKIQDGYGEYSGQGATKIAAQSEARTACVMNKVESYERRNGETPDEDTVDLFFDACINR